MRIPWTAQNGTAQNSASTSGKRRLLAGLATLALVAGSLATVGAAGASAAPGAPAGPVNPNGGNIGAQVAAPVPPPPPLPVPVGGLQVSTDQPFYNVGDPILVSYSVPGPGYFVIRYYRYNSSFGSDIYQGYDNGTGGAFYTYSAPPQEYGHLCIQFYGGFQPPACSANFWG